MCGPVDLMSSDSCSLRMPFVVISRGGRGRLGNLCYNVVFSSSNAVIYVVSFLCSLKNLKELCVISYIV